MKNCFLSVVIPVRANNNYNIIERLKFKRFDNQIPDNVEFIVVDDGSDENSSELIKKECHNLKYRYFKIESADKYFSLARARNYGAQNAFGKYLMTEDVDFAPYKGFYKDIIDEIELWDLNNKQEDFFTVPAIWLTESASKEYIENNSYLTAKKLIQKYLEFDTNYFEFGIPCGSVVVVSKHHYLSIGGQNESFDRWGFEDHEFANRLLTFSKKFPDPISAKKYFPTKFEEYNNYEGFRSRYRLYGDLIAAKGIYTFHINHPISTDFRSPKIRENNKKIFETCAEKLSKNSYYLGSLCDLTNQERTLISSPNPFVYNNEIWPLLGSVYFYDDELHTTDEYLKFIEENRITTVLMQNPYKKENKLKIYHELKKKGIRCVVAERGALPGSVYFDDTGFCCESSKYSAEYWDKELSLEERQKILNYIKEYKATGVALEKQSSLIGGKQLRNEIKLSDNQKILFVPFQTKTDTTVTYFAGKIGSYDNFVQLVRDVAKSLPKDWVVCYKNHPIEPEKNSIENAICVDNYHINDILEASSAVMLMNSGCGVLSMIYGLPVLHCSQAQYDNPKLNRYISTLEEVLEFSRKPFTVDMEDCYKFLYYIVFELYSYAENVYEKRKGKPDSWPVRLIFETIKYPNRESIIYFRDSSKAVWRKSVLFDRYRTFINTKYDELRKSSNKKEPTASKTSVKKQAVAAKIDQPKSKVANIEKKELANTQNNHSIESKFFNTILSEKLANKYNKSRDEYFKDSKSTIAKLYYYLNK